MTQLKLYEDERRLVSVEPPNRGAAYKPGSNCVAVCEGVTSSCDGDERRSKLRDAAEIGIVPRVPLRSRELQSVD
ncbi:hypothetical protein HBH56_021690 [Parastagonospora nodorum]|uniref:Uncharacterized protein n=1 Tax=Phaeosphaeria nodorum (strain SN15 / ATCC MYA-4574 / FGSC 10173) TaxID=321614 RepID=A0A7U2EZ46_PHANO|nr:hypothetical protein HBH56_021690 [Parastagonospora nodorum]QRC95526.1 hypothetical protein JI435_407470 [Parastagonospora nodorum SN15]KAH3937203.1 hypothetical protein HBH54_012800 [Parastagonospora nodorum]KAH4116999.1 hypothetical protein HBH47_159400 [Parastagonospora nodorum]KAH4137017.1 hypothetical protein HBH45_127990 [Parastagonospora nodorum]